MDKFKEQISDEKRRSSEKQNSVKIQWQDELHFNVLDEDGHIKYIGKIDPEHPEQEMCTCPDQFHRNTENFRATHGFALQCKHLINAHEMRGD